MSEPQSINLPEILALHAQWAADSATGQRADLAGANLAGAYLAGAYLTGAYLTGANLARANLSGADLRGANLAGADLAWADLAGADLAEADFSGANLTRADLRGAYLTGVLGLAIATDAPQRLRAAATAALQKDSLEMCSWHACDTRHCLGGWLIHQAGELGRLMEAAVGPELTGLMLGGIEAHSHFYDTNEAATEWLRSVLERPEAEVAK